jgi:hypothetical protein
MQNIRTSLRMYALLTEAEGQDQASPGSRAARRRNRRGGKCEGRRTGSSGQPCVCVCACNPFFVFFLSSPPFVTHLSSPLFHAWAQADPTFLISVPLPLFAKRRAVGDVATGTPLGRHMRATLGPIYNGIVGGLVRRWTGGRWGWIVVDVWIG